MDVCSCMMCSPNGCMTVAPRGQDKGHVWGLKRGKMEGIWNPKLFLQVPWPLQLLSIVCSFKANTKPSITLPAFSLTFPSHDAFPETGQDVLQLHAFVRPTPCPEHCSVTSAHGPCVDFTLSTGHLSSHLIIQGTAAEMQSLLKKCLVNLCQVAEKGMVMMGRQLSTLLVEMRPFHRVTRKVFHFGDPQMGMRCSGKIFLALAGLAQRLEHRPADKRDSGSIPANGM
uniref:Uncharacterized protein n=1 Tax=Molossus molossus TaxID=27622 RepID=A0A7J8BYC9_MOLMO|nr:hypothetical protein HJG59_010018 [Molossus molossus]